MPKLGIGLSQFGRRCSAVPAGSHGCREGRKWRKQSQSATEGKTICYNGFRLNFGRRAGEKQAWFKTPAIRVTVLALSTGVGSCSGFCLPRSGGISLPVGASPRVGAVGSE